jgi:hypothetical protein
VSIFKRRMNLGAILLGIWLIASGVLALVPIPIPFGTQLLALLAIAAGVCLFLDR